MVESLATFRKDKLEPYSRALGAWRGKETVRLLIVAPDEKRRDELQAAAREYPEVAQAARVIALDEWVVGGDIFAPNAQQRTAQNENMGEVSGVCGMRNIPD